MSLFDGDSRDRKHRDVAPQPYVNVGFCSYMAQEIERHCCRTKPLIFHHLKLSISNCREKEVSNFISAPEDIKVLLTVIID